MLLHKWLTTFGRYLILMGRTFSVPERMRMFWKQYVKEMAQLGVNSIGIVLLISFFIGAVICIQMKLNIQSPWMPRWVSGYTTREIMLLEFSSSIMCIVGAYFTAYGMHIIAPDDLTAGIQHDFVPWFMWMSIIKSLFFAFIISSVPAFCGYTVEGGSVNVGKASTDAVVSSSVLILFSDVFLTQLLS